MEYKPEDIRIDTFHACEHSGFVHTNHTAVRITHLPTGAYVESKTERSLHMNRQRCMELLPGAIEARMGIRSISRAEELISDLEAEIVKRDARIAELEHRSHDAEFNLKSLYKRAAIALSLDPDNTSWFEIVGDMEKVTAIKEQQRGGVAPGSVIPDRDGLVAAVCVLRSQGLGNLADSVSDALTALDAARLNPQGEGVAVDGVHDSDCSTNNRGCPELLGPCDCSASKDI